MLRSAHSKQTNYEDEMLDTQYSGQIPGTKTQSEFSTPKQAPQQTRLLCGRSIKYQESLKFKTFQDLWSILGQEELALNKLYQNPDNQFKPMTPFVLNCALPLETRCQHIEKRIITVVEYQHFLSNHFHRSCDGCVKSNEYVPQGKANTNIHKERKVPEVKQYESTSDVDDIIRSIKRMDPIDFTVGLIAAGAITAIAVPAVLTVGSLLVSTIVIPSIIIGGTVAFAAVALPALAVGAASLAVGAASIAAIAIPAIAVAAPVVMFGALLGSPILIPALAMGCILSHSRN